MLITIDHKILNKSHTCYTDAISRELAFERRNKNDRNKVPITYTCVIKYFRVFTEN